uniref:Uncharacterized protein n=1 Tax=Peronospora matthiolae TaxID=2874970 RepID=A0AAV1UVZ3_9STRA
MLADSQAAVGDGERVRSSASSVEKRDVADTMTATPATSGGVTLKKFKFSGISIKSCNSTTQNCQVTTQKPAIFFRRLDKGSNDC